MKISTFSSKISDEMIDRRVSVLRPYIGMVGKCVSTSHKVRKGKNDQHGGMSYFCLVYKWIMGGQCDRLFKLRINGRIWTTFDRLKAHRPCGT